MCASVSLLGPLGASVGLWCAHTLHIHGVDARATWEPLEDLWWSLLAPVGPLEALLWRLGVLLGISWKPLVMPLGSLGVSRGLWEASWESRVFSLGFLGALEGLVVALGSLGRPWGGSWSSLVASLGSLGPSSFLFGFSWGLFGSPGEALGHRLG